MNHKSEVNIRRITLRMEMGNLPKRHQPDRRAEPYQTEIYTLESFQTPNTID